MTWLHHDDIEPLLQTSLADDEWIDRLISHTQGLVEAEIGVQDPAALPAGLLEVVAQIAARLWRAGKAAAANPPGHQQESLGPYQYSAGRLEAGWGLTQHERDQLARFRNPLQVLTTTRGDVETASPTGLPIDAPDPVFGEDDFWDLQI